ncbi:MAG: hypothetical protein IKO39_09715 [Treponema sp.]|nr:hypothetical protein [Treponema sp.]
MRRKGGHQTSLNSQFAVSLNSEKVAVGFLVFVAVPFSVAAVDFNQSLKGTSGLLEKPCGFHCVTPSGGKGESLDSVLSHGFNQLCRFVIPDHFADVEVIVAAVSGNLVLVKKAAGSVAKFLEFIPDCLVGGSGGVLLILCPGGIVGVLCIPDAVVKVLEIVHV